MRRFKSGLRKPSSGTALLACPGKKSKAEERGRPAQKRVSRIPKKAAPSSAAERSPSMIRVLLVPPFRPEHVSRFADLEGFSFRFADRPDDPAVSEAEIILGRPSEALLGRASFLRWLQLPFAGSNDYARLPAFAGGRISLTNLSGAFGQSISEVVLGYVLALYKHLHLYRDHQARREWVDEGWQDSPVGKRVLILGTGNIGCETARLLSVFTGDIVGLRRDPRAVPPFFRRVVGPEELDRELPEADIAVGALPESPETHWMLNRGRLFRMKKTALVINVGRGGLIDSDALADALREGRIAGAALDVTDPEPLPGDHPLWGCPNLILTPHISGGSFGHLKATEERLFDICRANLIRFRAGEPLLNRVDPETGYRVSENRYEG